jgi:Ca-activated chloride channel family protein
MEANFVLNYDVVSMGREDNLYVLARIKAGANDSDKLRRPLNLSVVLDRSGSMGGEKLNYVKQAAQFLVKHLGASDRFSLVTYDTDVYVTVPPAAVVQKDVINQQIQKITAGGSTNLSGGWLQGCQLVAAEQKEGQNHRVLLLTDGLANSGITDGKRLAAMARQKREEGVVTTTMGVGMDFNEDLLVQMASEGGGAFYFIDNPDRTPQIFAEELQNLLNVVGQNLVITLTPTADVRFVRQLNAYPGDKQGNSVSFRLGDLYADEIKTLMLELHIPALQTLGEVEVAKLRFDYDELKGEQVTHRSLELPIRVNVTADSAQRESNAEVTKMALLLRTARIREEAVRHADQGQFDQAKQLLSGMAAEIQEQKLNDQELEAEHKMLQEEAMDMELGADRYDSYSRKASSTKSYVSSSTLFRHSELHDLHQRMKSSRKAIERNGATPKIVRWNKEQRELTGDLFRIGRADDNEIVVDEEPVSRYHCQIMREGDALYLTDLNSTNFTFANGGRVTDRFRLSTGDIVTVGTCLFNFE